MITMMMMMMTVVVSSCCPLQLVRLRLAIFAQLIPLCPAFADVLRVQIQQNLPQQAFVFGEQTSTVLHGHVQSPPVELHEGDGELKRLVKDGVQVPLEGVSFPPA